MISLISRFDVAIVVAFVAIYVAIVVTTFVGILVIIVIVVTTFVIVNVIIVIKLNFMDITFGIYDNNYSIIDTNNDNDNTRQQILIIKMNTIIINVATAGKFISNCH